MSGRAQALRDFCAEEGVLDVYESVNWLLRSPPDNPLPNLIEMLTDPGSEDILVAWAGSPLVDAFRSFALKLDPWLKAHRFDKAIPRGGAKKIKQTFSPIRTRFYLSAMLVSPIDVTDSQITLLRRLLRLWLFFESVERLTGGNVADSNLSFACRFLIADEKDEPRWKFLDSFLQEAWNLCKRTILPWRMTRHAFERTVTLLRPNTTDTSEGQFLDAVEKLSRGISEPFPYSDSESELKPLTLLRSHLPETSSLSSAELEIGAGQRLFAEIHPVDADGDNVEHTTLVEVEGDATPAQQRTTSSAFTFNDLETASFLPWSTSRVLWPESEKLQSWVEHSLRATNAQQRVGAAIASIALTLGRSLNLAQRLFISDKPGEEWSISKSFGYALRLTPKRRNAWEPSNGVAERWIQPHAEEFVLEIDGQVKQVLLDASSKLSAVPETLGQLWDATALSYSGSIESWFRQQMKTVAPRLGSSNTGTQLGQAVFDRTHDHNLAAILESRPNSGLPAACGYATWTIANVESGFNQSLVTTSRCDSSHLIGSVLAPIESKLCDAIEQATIVVNDSARDQSPIVHHNRLTQYCVLALYAATGCRHLADPFDSPLIFNLEDQFVFIDDKHDEPGESSGRVVPLPTDLLELLNSYVGNHLAGLADKVRSHRPSLAASIQQLIDLWGGTYHLPVSQGAIPLFFNLDNKLNWHHASDSSVPGLPLMDWPLPSNVFRHRYSQMLLRGQVPSQIIDGWMGHRGSALKTYGDCSPRTALNDMKQYLSTVEEVFRRLTFTTQPMRCETPLVVDVDVENRLREPDQFGEWARKTVRQQKKYQETQAALADIDSALLKVPPQELTQQHFDRIIETMLFREDGRVHRYVGLRLETLDKEVHRWGMEGKLLIRRRLAPRLQETSPLNNKAPQALRILSELKRHHCGALTGIYAGQVSKKTLLMAAVVLLCVEKRIAYGRMLQDIAQGKNYRIVQIDRISYLEYSELLNEDDLTTPVQRHQISHNVAGALEAGRGYSRGHAVLSSPCPGQLHSMRKLLFGHKDITFEHLLKQLVEIVAQANVVELPGIVAAALSERAPPTSLPLLDWQRLVSGRRLVDSTADSTSDPRVVLSVIDEGHWEAATEGVNASDRARRAREFYAAVRAILPQYPKSKSQQAADQIEALCRQSTGEVSSMVRLVAHWLVDLMRRGKRGPDKRFAPHAPSTIKRYLAALIQPFSELGHSINVSSFDEGAMTEFCQSVIDERVRQVRRPSYDVHRLIELMSYAGDLGMDLPNWSELDIPVEARVVRPGAISVSDYERAHHFLKSQLSVVCQQRSMHARWILFLSFRFGLRRSEALGLQGRDWREQDDWCWVLVRRNSHRDLKSPAARRALPLLSAMTDEERRLADDVLTEYQSISGGDDRYPIIGSIDEEGRAVLADYAPSLFRDITTALRTVTANPNVVVHHLRHAFYNRELSLLTGVQTPSVGSLTSDVDDEVAHRRVVLGDHDQPSSRSLMAIARMMGHRHPRVGLKSYAHWITEWADNLTPMPPGRYRNIASFWRLDQWQSHPETQDPPIKNDYRSPDWMSILKLFRLVATGWEYDAAGVRMGFSPENVSTIARTVAAVSASMRFHDSSGWFVGDEKTLVSRMGTPAWTRLLAVANVRIGDCKSLVDSSGLVDMVGANGEIRMLNESDFNLMRTILDAFSLDPHCDCLQIGDNPVIEDRAKRHGFNPRVIAVGAEEGVNQYGRHYGGVRHIVCEFAVIKLQRNQQAIVRNNYQMALLVVLAGLALMLSSTTNRDLPEGHL